MIKVNFFKEKGKFSVSAKLVKDTVTKAITDNGITSDFEVNVSIVGSPTMLEIGRNFYHDDKPDIEHPIFTFPEHERKGEFATPPDQLPSLGDIYISYPWVLNSAKENNDTPTNVLVHLLEHGCLHLLGIHH